MTRFAPPRPASRPEGLSLRARLRLFREDIFRSQPERLYRAKMATVSTPIRSSFLCNDPELVHEVLDTRAADFPKARLVGRTLRPLLGRSVFVTNGDAWAQPRRIIDMAFSSGRLRETHGAMIAAGEAAIARLAAQNGDPVEIEFAASHLAADVIFRSLFSIPITDEAAADICAAFRAYQRHQPILSLTDIAGLPSWLSFWRRPRGRREAREIRTALARLVKERAKAIANGTAPDDIATRIMTATDPETGRGLDERGMVDQVAIFFLAGHETSASALSWALYCLAEDPEAQRAAHAEVDRVMGDNRAPCFADLGQLRFLRDVFRETLRLYPPVPVMLREAGCPATFRGRQVRRGDLVMVSPWHLQRHRDFWQSPDLFDPWRWHDDATRKTARDCYLPFSKGARVCTGAGFAMLEGVTLLAMVLKAFEIEPTGTPPVPVAHLTVRSEAGIWLRLRARDRRAAPSDPEKVYAGG